MRQVCTITTLLVLLSGGQLAHAQIPVPSDGPQYGWLEGTITNNQGQPIMAQRLVAGGEVVKGVRQGGGEFKAEANTDMGGLYSATNLRPGVYDITLEKGWINSQTPYCPECIFGVVIKPGQRTVLNVVMDQGETYEEVGKPAIVTAPATNVTAELAQMQKQIDDLKQQVAALQQKIKDTTAPATPALAPATTPPAKP